MTWKVGSRWFPGARNLVEKDPMHGGLDAFKRRWSNLVEKGHASSILARAAFVTSRGFEAMDFVDLLLDSYSISSRPEEKNIKWPMNVSAIVPELSPWLLAPDSMCSEKIFELIARECPEVMASDESTKISDKDMLKSKLGCYSWRMADCVSDQIPLTTHYHYW